MVITQTGFTSPIRSNGAPAAPAQPAAPAPAEEPRERIDAFYCGTSNTAKWMSRIDGVVLGGVLGLTLGAAVGAAVFGPSSFGALLSVGALGAGGVYGGYQVGDKFSAFGGKIGAGIDETNPKRGEAFGRVGANVALSLLSGNWRSAAANIAIPVAGGAISYALASDTK